MNSTKVYVFASGLLVYLPVGLFIKLRINVYQIFGDDRPCVREQLDFLWRTLSVTWICIQIQKFVVTFTYLEKVLCSCAM